MHSVAVQILSRGREVAARRFRAAASPIPAPLMRGRRVGGSVAAGLLATALPAVALLAGAAPAAHARTLGACGPPQLAASMKLIPDSQGAGNIEYQLVLTNSSDFTCTIGGVPAMQLRDVHGRALPTRVLTVTPGRVYSTFSIAPGQSAVAVLRFSPDVPGTGDRQTGACQPVAHSVRVTIPSPGHGSLVGAISPPTSVCERGTLQTAALKPASS